MVRRLNEKERVYRRLVVLHRKASEFFYESFTVDGELDADSLKYSDGKSAFLKKNQNMSEFEARLVCCNEERFRCY